MSETKTGWLIEVGQLCVGECQEKSRLVTFTDPKARRFKTKQEAKEFAEKNYIHFDQICEHQFDWT